MGFAEANDIPLTPLGQLPAFDLLAFDVCHFPVTAIRVPNLIIRAEQDAFLPMGAAERLKKYFGGPTQLKTIPACGHFLQEENPQEVTWLMMTFLEEQSQSNDVEWARKALTGRDSK